MEKSPPMAFDEIVHSLINVKEGLTNFNSRLSGLHHRLFGPQPVSGKPESDVPEPMGALPTIQLLLSDIEDQAYALNKHIEKLEGIV